MQPEQPKPDENVWISREEYERLRQAEAVQASNTPVVSLGQPVVMASPVSAVQSPRRNKTDDMAIIVTGVAAALLIGSLSFSSFRGFAAPLIGVFMIFGAWTLIKMLRHHEQVERSGIMTSAATAESDSLDPKNVAKTLGKGLLIGGFMVVAAPFFFGAAIMVLFIIIMIASGGNVGS